MDNNFLIHDLVQACPSLNIYYQVVTSNQKRFLTLFLFSRSFKLCYNIDGKNYFASDVVFPQ